MEIWEVLKIRYKDYQEKSIDKRRFTHGDIQPFLDRLGSSASFAEVTLGESAGGRSIRAFTYGRGQIKVMLWSQMHGNEPTATAALLDLFNFLLASDEYDNVRTEIQEKLTLLFVPMLNPDGTEVFKRQNAWDVDLNRDAARSVAPESKILWQAFKEFRPDFGFNLHDMHAGHYVGDTGKQASIAFLAPAVDPEKSVPPNRQRAMQLIALMNKKLQEEIPGQVSRYDDSFDNRCFGERLQMEGAATILVESGAYPKDAERQYVRKLNFLLIVEALKALVSADWQKYTCDDYFSIPDDSDGFLELIVRGVQLERNGTFVKVDIGIESEECGISNNRDFFERCYISEIGDLSTKCARKEIVADGMVLREGKTLDRVVETTQELDSIDMASLTKERVVSLRMKDVQEKRFSPATPIYFLSEDETPEHNIGLNAAASFFLEKDGQLHYAIVNGHVYCIA